MTSLYEVLKASRIPSSAPDMYTAIWAKNLTGGGYTPTEHQYTGEVPTVIIANGEPLISCLIYGNMSQTGTPTPTTPIQPQECGERTGNLFDKDNTTVYNAYIGNNSYWLLNADSRSIKIVCSPNTTYTLTINVPNNAVFRIYETDNENAEPTSSETVLLTEIIRGTTNQSYSFTTGATTKAIVFQGSAAYVTDWINSLMLNTGSTALPYEPYGYKIPISSANTTTPVYLGEVETTRKIKKYIFDGTEQWQRTANGAYYLPSSVTPMTDYWQNSSITSVNSHFAAQENVTGSSSVADGKSAFYRGGSPTTKEYYIAARDISTTADFKAYLAQQYAAGTPVCVWYVLATPQTAVVNEPLRKIGEYADSVSVSDVPTVEGSQTFDVETDLKPSSVDITYIG